MPDPDDLLDDDQRLIAEAVRDACRDFDDEYWAACDREHRFPWDFYARMAEGGWVGIALPSEYGGGGRGITDAAVVLHEIARERRGDERLLRAAPHDLRAQPGRAVRQRPAEGRRSCRGPRPATSTSRSA